MTGWWALVLSLLTTVPTAPDPPRSDRPAVLTLSGKPRIGYVDGHVLRLPDGSSVQLPKRWGVIGIAAYDGGYLVSDDRVFEGTVGMAKLGADGNVLDSWTGTGPPVVSRDGRLAWVSMSVAEADQHGPTVLHADSVEGGHELTQRINRHLMPFLRDWWRGRLVYETWGRRSSFLTDLVSAPQPIPPAQDLGDVGPDGRLFARSTVDGVELRQYDGQLLNVIKVRGLTRTQANDLAWEDARHLLATLTRGHRMCVVRIGLGGRISRATPWQKADVRGFAFVAAR